MVDQQRREDALTQRSGMATGVPQPSPTAGTGVVVPFLNTAARIRYIVAWVVVLGVGLTALVAGATDSFTTSGSGSRILGIALGAVFTLLGGVMALMTRRVFGRAIGVDATGVRLIDPRGRSFQVQWPELSQVGICTLLRGTGFRRFPIGFLDLIPGDAGFAGRHPEMSVLYHKFRAGPWWRLPLGPARRLVGPLNAALRTFAGPRYGGIADLRDLPQG